MMLERSSRAGDLRSSFPY